MTGFTLNARSFAWRLHCADGAIETSLHSEVGRLAAARAFVVSSPSIASHTSTVARVERALADAHAGTFAGIENDSTFRSVEAATAAARDAGADLIVAVGGGSVIVAARAVDIFLCEAGRPFDLMTQYPEGGRAVSPRLNAPKLPIINIVTTPTSAMNRAGTGLKNPDLNQRMEYFDPKTRPASIIWDWAALMATPLPILRSTATTTFIGSWSSILNDEPNPLVNGDRQQAFACARAGFGQLASNPDAIGPRLDLCAAAFLANRAEDDHAGPMIRGGGSRRFLDRRLRGVDGDPRALPVGRAGRGDLGVAGHVDPALADGPARVRPPRGRSAGMLAGRDERRRGPAGHRARPGRPAAGHGHADPPLAAAVPAGGHTDHRRRDGQELQREPGRALCGRADRHLYRAYGSGLVAGSGRLALDFGLYREQANLESRGHRRPRASTGV